MTNSIQTTYRITDQLTDSTILDRVIGLFQFADTSWFANFLTLALWLALIVGLVALAVSWLEEFWHAPFMDQEPQDKDQNR